MNNVKEDMRYRVAIIRDTNDQYHGAYCPDSDNYLDVGDIVKLADGTMASVLMSNDYVSGENLLNQWKITGMAYKRIVSTYRNRPVEWEDEDDE